MSVSYLHFQSSKNIKVKAHSEYQNESTQSKGSIPRVCPTGIRKNTQNCKLKVLEEVHF